MEPLEYFSVPDYVEKHLSQFYDADPDGTFGEALIEAILRSRFKELFTRDDQILVDFGCGEGRLMAQLINGLGFKKAVGVDGSAHMLALLKKNVRSRGLRKVHLTTLHTDLARPIPLPPRHAALVNCMGTSMYISDLEHIFSEAERILRTNSLFCLSISVHEDEHMIEVRGEEPYPNYFIHPEKQLKRLIEKFGFTLENCFLTAPSTDPVIKKTTKYLILKKGVPKKN